MTANTNNTTARQHKTICIKRTFNLPLTTIWKAWSEPESFRKWGGPENYTCPQCFIDFKVDGKYLNSMQAEDGSEIWSTGTYEEIIPLKKIVYTDSFADNNGNIIPASDYKMAGEWNSPLKVTVEFEDVDLPAGQAGGKTNITLQHAGIPDEAYEDCIAGWQSSLDKLARNIK